MELPEDFKRAAEDYIVDQLSHSNEQARSMWEIKIARVYETRETHAPEAHITIVRKPSQTFYKWPNFPMERLSELLAALGPLGNIDHTMIK